MENGIEYETSKINEWFETYELSQEQLARLIAEKVARAENYSLVHRQVVRHLGGN